MDIKIRECKIDDYEALSELYLELDNIHSNEHPEIFIKQIKNPRNKDYIEKVLKNVERCFFVAEKDREIVGFIEGYICKSGIFQIYVQREWVQIDSIIVKKNYNNLHIGTLLLEEVKNWGKKFGINRLELMVYSFNKNAMRFYKRKGFVDLNRRMYLEF